MKQENKLAPVFFINESIKRKWFILNRNKRNINNSSFWFGVSITRRLIDFVRFLSQRTPTKKKMSFKLLMHLFVRSFVLSSVLSEHFRYQSCASSFLFNDFDDHVIVIDRWSLSTLGTSSLFAFKCSFHYVFLNYVEQSTVEMKYRLTKVKWNRIWRCLILSISSHRTVYIQIKIKNSLHCYVLSTSYHNFELLICPKDQSDQREL